MSVLAQLVGGVEHLREEKLRKEKEENRAEERRKRKELASVDFGFFCITYLSHYFFADPAAYQKALYEIADTQSLSPDLSERLKEFVHEKYHGFLRPTERLAGAMFNEPREHGKTVRWTFAYPLWRAVTGKSRYILLIGAAGSGARENLSNIKKELEENDELIEDFGDLKGDIWRDDRLELANGACLQAKGAGMSMRGTRFRQHRPDLILLDDILKDEEVESPAIRKKIHRWLKRVVFNLGKNAFIVWVNTIFHGDDPISRLLRELEEGTLKRWIAVRLSCWMPDGETPLWKEYWTKDALEEKRQSLGHDDFSTEWENEPLSDEERIIKREWIEAHWYAVLEYPIGTLRCFAGVDPATGKHDQTAIVSLGVDRKGVLWEMDSWGRTCSELETVRQLIIKHRLYSYELIGWEDVNFTGIYANYVSDMAASEGVYLPIKKIKASTTTNAKTVRVRYLSPLIENGLLRLREKGAKELIEQLTNYPKWRFDDLCDGLWYAVAVASTGPGAPVIRPIESGGLGTRVRNILRGYRTHQ